MVGKSGSVAYISNYFQNRHIVNHIPHKIHYSVAYISNNKKDDRKSKLLSFFDNYLGKLKVIIWSMT